MWFGDGVSIRTVKKAHVSSGCFVYTYNTTKKRSNLKLYKKKFFVLFCFCGEEGGYNVSRIPR